MDNTEDNNSLLETLFERVADFSKTGFEIVKLKTIDKITDLVSSFVPFSIFIAFLFIFLLFLNLGVAFWLGEIMGKLFYGFFVVAAFYILIGLVLHFVFHKPIKRAIGNYFVKHLLK